MGRRRPNRLALKKGVRLTFLKRSPVSSRARIVDNKHPAAVALVSGGLDSAVAAGVAIRECASVTFMHASYGQRTWKKERICARKLARRFSVELIEMKLPHLGSVGGSCLTDPSIDVPRDALGQDGVPVSYVPFRNANLLSAAVTLAESVSASAVYIGAVEEDSSGYPDCRKSFFRAFERMVGLGTRPETHIVVETPVIRLAKRDIVRLGVTLAVPFAATWSCYQNEQTACGACDSCLLRINAFRSAGVADPIPYA